MQTLHEQFHAVYESMINGQRRQAVEQAQELGLYNIPDMLEYFDKDLGKPYVALDFTKSYFRIVSR